MSKEDRIAKKKRVAEMFRRYHGKKKERNPAPGPSGLAPDRPAPEKSESSPAANDAIVRHLKRQAQMAVRARGDSSPEPVNPSPEQVNPSPEMTEREASIAEAMKWREQKAAYISPEEAKRKASIAACMKWREQRH